MSGATFSSIAEPRPEKLAVDAVYRLPSGAMVTVLRMAHADSVDCGYMRDGRLAPAGENSRNRVTLLADFLLRHARTVA